MGGRTTGGSVVGTLATRLPPLRRDATGSTAGELLVGAGVVPPATCRLLRVRALACRFGKMDNPAAGTSDGDADELWSDAVGS